MAAAEEDGGARSRRAAAAARHPVVVVAAVAVTATGGGVSAAGAGHRAHGVGTGAGGGARTPIRPRRARGRRRRRRRGRRDPRGAGPAKFAVKGSSDSEPRLRAGEVEGEGDGWVQQKFRLENYGFLFALYKSACSLSCERQRCRAQAGAVCVQVLSRLSWRTALRPVVAVVS